MSRSLATHGSRLSARGQIGHPGSANRTVSPGTGIQLVLALALVRQVVTPTVLVAHVRHPTTRLPTSTAVVAVVQLTLPARVSTLRGWWTTLYGLPPRTWPHVYGNTTVVPCRLPSIDECGNYVPDQTWTKQTCPCVDQFLSDVQGLANAKRADRMLASIQQKATDVFRPLAALWAAIEQGRPVQELTELVHMAIVMPGDASNETRHQRLMAALPKRCPKSLLQGLHPSGDGFSREYKRKCQEMDVFQPRVPGRHRTSRSLPVLTVFLITPCTGRTQFGSALTTGLDEATPPARLRSFSVSQQKIGQGPPFCRRPRGR